MRVLVQFQSFRDMRAPIIAVINQLRAFLLEVLAKTPAKLRIAMPRIAWAVLSSGEPYRPCTSAAIPA
jgi:hypothetical protein